LTGLPCPSCARYTLMSPLPLIRSLALSKPGVHVIACSTAGKSMDDGDTDGVKRSKQRSGRNAERKAKQAELIELRGPHSNVTPQTWSERLRQMEASAARESGVGGSTPLKGAAAVVRSLQTVAAKAAARSAVRASPGRQNLPISTIAPGQPAPGQRSKEKVVELPSELDDDESPYGSMDEHSPETTDEHGDLTVQAWSGAAQGRITIYSTAETLDRELLATKLLTRGPNYLLQEHPDVLYGRYTEPGGVPLGDIFYFDYGCVVFWGLTQEQEQDILRTMVVPCEVNPLPVSELEIDEFNFRYTSTEKPHIRNDTITISKRAAADHTIKLSISYALAQSTKLCVFEERVLMIVEATRDLPGTLAATGEVNLKRKEVAQLIGRVFIQKAGINLLSTVLDTPEFFWSAPDAMQHLYERVCAYIELDNRVEVLNNRLMVLQEMLDMVRDHQNNHHASRLELTVIWLIVIEVLLHFLP